MLESFLNAAGAAGGVVTLVTTPLLCVLALTAVFARGRARRLATHRVLAMLWPFDR